MGKKTELVFFLFLFGLIKKMNGEKKKPELVTAMKNNPEAPAFL